MAFQLLPFLGGLAKTAFTSAVTSKLGASLDRSNARKDYQNQRGMGFTHSEIAGSGGAGASGTSETVMGNQANQFLSQKRQQDYEAEQRNIDRAVTMRGQDVASQNAAIAAGASRYSSDTQRDIQSMHNERQWQSLANDWANNNPQLNLRFKQMSMGFENVRLELVLARNGLSLANTADMGQAEFNRRMTSVMSELAALEGVGGLKNEGLREGVATINDGLNPANPVLGNTNYGTPSMPSAP